MSAQHSRERQLYRGTLGLGTGGVGIGVGGLTDKNGRVGVREETVGGWGRELLLMVLGDYLS